MLRNTAGTRNLYEAGIRPYIWITDNIAIQGQIYGGYIDNVRGFEASSNPTINPGTLSPTAFGRSGSMGVFTIAPTIKPRGGFFTRPELGVFATYSICLARPQIAVCPRHISQRVVMLFSATIRPEMIISNSA